MKITQDEYFKLLERFVKGAEYLENPLIIEADFRKGMELYNAIESEIDRYQQQLRENGYTHQPIAAAGDRPDQKRAS